MRKNLMKRQIPTILGLVILFIGAGAGVILVGSGAGFLPRASPEYAPKKLQITNVTDRAFTVSWITDEPTVGFVRYAETSDVKTTVTDDRDQLSGDTGSFMVHHVTIRGLRPDSTYYYKIGSGPSQALYDNQGQAYQIVTAKTLGTPEDPETIFGKVVTAAQTPADGTLVYIHIDGAAPISTLVKASGSWAESLSTMRSKDLSAYFDYTNYDDQISFEIVDSQGQITTGLSDIEAIQPVPTITLGEDFDFSSGKSSASNNTEAAIDNVDEEKSPIELLNPSFEGEKINSTKPEIQGIAPANTKLEILVESLVPYEDTFTTDETGEFAWSPPDHLEPGDHKITISWIDELGVRQFFERNFVVLAQGESDIPALTATPSATPKATATPTATPLASTLPTATPKATATPTAKPTLTPTATASGTDRVTQPSTSSSIPVAGSVSQTLWMLFFGSLFVTTGVVLAKKID